MISQKCSNSYVQWAMAWQKEDGHRISQFKISVNFFAFIHIPVKDPERLSWVESLPDINSRGVGIGMSWLEKFWKLAVGIYKAPKSTLIHLSVHWYFLHKWCLFNIHVSHPNERNSEQKLLSYEQFWFKLEKLHVFLKPDTRDTADNNE